MNRLRLLFVIDSLGQAAGTENQVIELLKGLNPERFELHLACLADSSRMAGLRKLARTAIFPIGILYAPGGLWQVWRMRRYMRTHHIDAVHTFMVKGTIAGALAAMKAVPLLITSRRSLGYWYTPRLIRLFRLLNAGTTRVLANCEAVKRVTVEAEGLAASRVDVIYNGVDQKRFESSEATAETARELGIPKGARVVGVVANYRPVKNLDLFLRAAALVAQEYPEVVFLLAGKGELRENLAALACDLGIRESVYFTDGRGSIPALLHRMCIACLPSSSEGFSNAILEYLAAGLPVIATGVGGNAEAVVHGQTGLITPPGDAEAMAAAIRRLLGNEEERSRMAAQAREHCRRSYDMPKFIQQLEEYYFTQFARATGHSLNNR